MPEMMKDINTLREGIGEDGALSAKTKTLMMMLGDGILGHGDGVANIARQARAMGTTEAEIAETVGVAFMMGGMPAFITCANAFRT